MKNAILSLLTVGLVATVLIALTASFAPADDASKNDFKKPSPEEALKFLKSLPRVWRNTRADFRGKKILVQLWEKHTVEDLKTQKLIHPGGHVEDPDAPNRFSRRHLYIKPADWKYFTVFGALEEFQVGHDLEGITDECLFYLGQLPQSMHTIKLEMSQATGKGVKHLQNLKNLKYLSLNFSRTITDVALVHAGKIESLEVLDVCGCPAITGTGVSALSKLKNLKTLKIGSCSLSNASLKHFKSLTIEELDLSHVEEGWIIQYRGGGRCRFTITPIGLRNFIADKKNLPDLKRLILKKTRFTKEQKAALAKLRPGLVVN